MTASLVALLCRLLLFLHLFYSFFSYIFILIHIHHPTPQKSKAHLSATKNKKHPPNPSKNANKKTSVYDTHLPTSIAGSPTGSSTVPTVPRGAAVGVVRQQSSFGSICLDAFASLGSGSVRKKKEKKTAKTAKGWN